MGLVTYINSNSIELSPRSRSPLMQRTTSPCQLPPKQVRRKNTFILTADSSEEIPSPHDSIFEAYYLSANSSEASSNRADITSVEARNGITTLNGIRVNDENAREQEFTTVLRTSVDPEFRYGHGTVLETITEKRSSTTIRTLARPKSVDGMLGFPFLHHQDSFSVAKSPRRKLSFSLDDLALVKSSYHEACATIERTICKALPLHEIYAEPKVPIHAPLERPATPPGMPSWSAAQLLPPRRPRVPKRPGSPSRLKRFLGLSSSGITTPIQASGILNRTVSAPIRGRTAPRFRPPKSVYAAIDQHPFNTALIAKVDWRQENMGEGSADPSNIQQSSRRKVTGKRKPGQKVRFTPSATARDSEVVALQRAIESTSNLALHPNTVMEAISTGHPNCSTKLIQCPHRRGRRASLKALKNNLNTPPASSEYSVLQSFPDLQNSLTARTPTTYSATSSSLRLNSTASSNIDEFGAVVQQCNSQTASISSTAHLMSGALLDRSTLTRQSTPLPMETGRAITPVSQQPSPQEEVVQCWKCRLDKIFAKMDQWWLRSTSLFCLVCCGFDVDDDLSVGYGGGMGGTCAVPPYGPTLRGGELDSEAEMEIFGPRRAALGSSEFTVL